MARTVSRLFHAVVVVGASLACDSREDAPPATPETTSASSVNATVPEGDGDARPEGPEGAATSATSLGAATPEERPGTPRDSTREDGASVNAAGTEGTAGHDETTADDATDGDGTAEVVAEGEAEGPGTQTGGSATATGRRARPRPATTGTDTHASRMDACPPGSERPFPPCYHIL